MNHQNMVSSMGAAALSRLAGVGEQWLEMLRCSESLCYAVPSSLRISSKIH